MFGPATGRLGRRPITRLDAERPASPRAHVPTRTSSFPLPDRVALLREGTRALTRVLRREHRSRDLPLAGEELGFGPVRRLEQDALRRLQRERTVGGDRLRQLERQLKLVGPLRIERLSGERELDRDVARQYARQTQ